jgi:carbon monoxide dehydrogenase subunit G
MDMQATRSLSVTQQQAWQALNDPEVLKLCIPGCDKVEATAEHEYDIGMALRIGPVSAKFKGHIKLSDIVPPASYRISFEGQGGPAGFGKGSAQVQLTPTDSGCELAYTVNASVGGKVAQLGQRLIDGAAKSLAEDFFKRFDDEMQRRHSAAPAAPAAFSPPVGAASSSVLLPAVLAGVGGAVIMAAVLGLISR